VLVSAGCVPLLAGRDARLEAIWRASVVWLPPAALPAGVSNGGRLIELDEALRRRPPAAPIPVVLYAHGCRGIDDDLALWARALGPAGYALVAPDSGPAPTCAPDLLYTRRDAALLARRADELRYAREQLAYLAWIRRDVVFLLGFDQGAVLVAGWRGAPFSGYIVTGWSCTAPDVRDGLFTPPEQPVLAIRWVDDPLFSAPAWNGDCGLKAPARDDVRAVRLEGRGHSVAGDPEAQAAVLAFLRAHTP
jgi:hypothetical protein